VTVTGSTLVKTGGCDGCADASAVSHQQVTDGQGYVEFTAGDTRALRFVGLAFGGVGTPAGSLDFALRLQNGVVEVREAGAYKAESAFAAGDRFRISVDGGTVRYLKNGVVIHTSAGQATYPLHLHVAMFDAGASVETLTLGHVMAAAATASPMTESATAPAPTRQALPRPPGAAPRRR
jgi:hypothetical protein